jgi:uncharacterized protein (TIGR02231 family)
MKKSILLFTLCFILAITVSRSQAPVIVDSKIAEATVYLDGAELRFTENVAVKRGLSVLRFRGISRALVNNSVHVTANSSVNLVSVSVEEETLPMSVMPAKFRTRRDSINKLQAQIVDINNRISAYDAEQQMLRENQRVQAGTSLLELAKIADFFRERTLAIQTAQTELRRKLEAAVTMLAEKQEVEKRDPYNPLRYTVVVTVRSANDQAVAFSVRYGVQNAFWEASYDIIVPEINKPVVLQYNARVYNDTGLEWNNVKLWLSSGNLTQNSTRPYLTVWNLNYSSTGNEGYLNQYAQNRAFENMADTTAGTPRDVSELNASFDLEGVHSLASGGAPYVVGVKGESLQASYEYLTIPKVENSVFLLAKVTGWENLNLIDGVANVYYGNSYVGESNINTRLVGDTLELSLGRDNQIVVQRVKIEDKGSTSSLAGKRSESFVYEIQVRNNRKVGVALKIQDQLPISQEKDIVVDASEISGAKLDGASGRLQWLKSLGAGETVRYRIAFEVRYPKNKSVQIRKNRTVMTPRYRH